MNRQEKIRKLQALHELRRRRRVAPLLYHEFHDKQEEVFELARHKRVVLARGGNRSGKTTASATRAVELAYGYEIHRVPNLQVNEKGDYPDRNEIDPEFWIRRPDGVPINVPNKGLVVTGLPLRQGIGQIFWPKFTSLLPMAVTMNTQEFVVNRGQYSVPLRCQLPMGTEITFGSGEQATMTFEGADHDWVLFDEPPPRSIFGAVWRGLTDRYGPLFISMTPVGNDAPWIFEEFITKERNDVGGVQWSIWDNPFIPHEAKVEFLKGGSYTEEELVARETGGWMFLTHRAFPTADPAVHVVRPYEIPRDWVRGLCIDPAHRRPFALTWMAFGPNEEKVIYREWPQEDHSQMRSSTKVVRDYATIIRNLEGAEQVDFRILDPRFGKAHNTVKGQKQTSYQEDFAEFGLYFDCEIPGTEREETGIQRIRELLWWDKESPISILNRPKLQIFTGCQNSINSLLNSNFVPPSQRDSNVLPEKLLETYKDFRDNMRYLVLYPTPFKGDASKLAYLSEEARAEANDLYSL